MMIDTTVAAFQASWGFRPREVVPLVRGKALAASWVWPSVPVRPVSNPVLPSVHCISLLLCAMEGHFWLEDGVKYCGNIEAHSALIKAADSGSRWLSASPVSVFHVYLSDTYLRSLMTDRSQLIAGGSGPLQFQSNGYLDDGLVTELLQALHRSFTITSNGNKSYQASLTGSLARHIVQCHALPLEPNTETEFPADTLFERLLQAIIADPARAFTVEGFCQMTGMSSARLTAKFKSCTGHTPYRYLLVQRLELAKRELESGHVSLSDLAIRLGFVDQAHFSHAFRRYTGKTPGRARTSNPD